MAHTGATVVCPHCGADTVLYVASVEELQERATPTPPPPPRPLPPPRRQSSKPPKEALATVLMVFFLIWTGFFALCEGGNVIFGFANMAPREPRNFEERLRQVSHGEADRAAAATGATLGIFIWSVILFVGWLFGAVPLAFGYFAAKQSSKSQVGKGSEPDTSQMARAP